MIQQSEGIISRRWPVTIKNYWFGQRPEKQSMPDIARLHSIPESLTRGMKKESWTLLTDLSGKDQDIMSLLHRSTRTQVRRAEREGILVERFDSRHPYILDDFDLFFRKFAETKSEARDILNISVQLHMLKRLVDANMLEVSKAVGRDGEPIVYHVFIVANGRARVHLSASLFREGQNSEERHFMGWASRYLHWKDMLHYKQQGYHLYDMGGWYAGKDNESLMRINQFKEEFGGRVVCEYDALYGCTIPGKWALQIQSLFKSVLQTTSRRMTR
jgi:lipid II:glycine glycyltransferase (peptidoglycan interpeptide bridge formation enzyme)